MYERTVQPEVLLGAFGQGAGPCKVVRVPDYLHLDQEAAYLNAQERYLGFDYSLGTMSGHRRFRRRLRQLVVKSRVTTAA